MRLTLFAIITLVVLLVAGFVFLLVVSSDMDPGDEEVRVEVQGDFSQ